MTKINIDNLTLGDIKQTSSFVPQVEQVEQVTSDKASGYEDLMDKKIFIRTVTFYYTGILREIYDDILILEDASWIPDTGRFANALKNGSFDEVEPFFQKVTRVGRGGVMDVSEIAFNLPNKQK